MTKLRDYPEIIREALFAHEFFRRLDYPSEQIFVFVNELPRVGSDPPQTQIVVGIYFGDEKPPPFDYFVSLGSSPIHRERLAAQWHELASNVGEVAEKDFQRAWQRSAVIINAAAILADMAQHGIVPKKALS